MRGRRIDECHGQLATLDAIVFFSAAILVSSVLLSYDLSGTKDSGVGPTQDPANLLDVFLRASIGKEIVLELGEHVTIRSDDQIGECMILEIGALSQGMPLTVFQPLNQEFSIALDRLCDTTFRYRLVVQNADSEEVLQVGMDVDRECGNIFASSMSMRDVRGADYLVILSIFAEGS